MSGQEWFQRKKRQDGDHQNTHRFDVGVDTTPIKRDFMSIVANSEVFAEEFYVKPVAGLLRQIGRNRLESSRRRTN